MAAEDFGNNYTNALLEIAKGNIDFLNNTIKVLIVDENHVFDKSHQFVNDIVANELSGSGYERKTLSSKEILSATATPDEIRFRAADLVYSNIDAGTMANAIAYKEVTDDSDSLLITQANQPDIVTIGTNITVEWPDNASGVGTIFAIENPIVTA